MRNNQKDIAEKNVVLCILTGPMGLSKYDTTLKYTKQYYTPKRSMRYIYIILPSCLSDPSEVYVDRTKDLQR